jgi:hypothetical protein
LAIPGNKGHGGSLFKKLYGGTNSTLRELRLAAHELLDCLHKAIR